jgi:hypothetical protein
VEGRVEQRHADVVAAVGSDYLYVSEAIPQGRKSAGTLYGANDVASGWNLDLQMSAFCWQADVLPAAPIENVAIAVKYINKPLVDRLRVSIGR